MKPSQILLKLNQIGCGTVSINGTECSSMVRSTRIVAEAGELTRVEIEFYPELVTVEGLAEIVARPVDATDHLTTQADQFKVHRKDGQ